MFSRGFETFISCVSMGAMGPVELQNSDTVILRPIEETTPQFQIPNTSPGIM